MCGESVVTDDFIESLGPAFFAHRLRRLSEALVEDCGGWFRRVGVTSPPKAASTLLLLRQKGPQSVTQIAERLRLSHPMIINVTRELETLDMVFSGADPTDRRRRPIALTQAGEIQADRIGLVNAMMTKAYGRLFEDAAVDPMDAINRLEQALRTRPFSDRLDAVAFARVAEPA
jgi:DNA-binding MarR family transcriptional regulator